MKIFTQCVLVSALVFMNACASTPKSTMLVPSRSTITELEKLSHQAGTTVDVLTVNRGERLMVLDGSGGNALTGRDIDASATLAGTGPVVRIPFDDLALIYYSEGFLADKEAYPLLQDVGPAERGLNCDELDLELAQAETVRWYARGQGALPYVGHERGTQNAKKALKGVGKTMWVVLSIYGGYSGGGSSGHKEASLDAYRSAVTTADRRIIGLLELKRDHSCAPRDARIASETDLMVLGKIGESRQALAAKHMTDQEQANLQTLLLDQFDPVVPGTVQVDVVGELKGYERVTWYSNVDATENLKTLITQLGWRGEIKLTDEELEFRPESGADAPAGGVVRIRYADVASAVVANHGRWRGVIVTRRDGHKDTFCIAQGFGTDLERTQTVGEFLKSKVSTVLH